MVLIEWLTFQCRIREVPGLNFWAQIPAILTDVFRDFPHALQENAGIVPYIRSQPLPYTLFPIHNILYFDAIF
jgi:hypothetical protein